MPKVVKTLPPTDYLRQCFDYEAGLLRWRKRPPEHFRNLKAANRWNAQYAGQLVTTKAGKGYLLACFDGARFYVSRIIYKMYHGIDPEWLDHRDGNRTNNAIDNLRSVDMQQQNRNMLKRPGRSGHVGVAVRPGLVYGKPFRATIRDRNGKKHYLGVFDTAEEAHAAYVKAANEIFGEHSPFRR